MAESTRRGIMGAMRPVNTLAVAEITFRKMISARAIPGLGRCVLDLREPREIAEKTTALDVLGAGYLWGLPQMSFAVRFRISHHLAAT